MVAQNRDSGHTRQRAVAARVVRGYCEGSPHRRAVPVLPRLGLRRSSIVIGAVIVFVLAGLYATDRVLTQAARERLRIDAAESATLVESFLSQRAEALTVLRALYADGHASAHRLALAEYTVALTDFLPGIRRLWV